MKTFTVFFALVISLVGVSFSQIADAKKKRYIKREHGLQFNVDASFIEEKNLTFDLAYSYNYKGWLEFGPYWNFYIKCGLTGESGVCTDADYELGLKLIEYNFVKNRGRRKIIPSVGLKAGLYFTGKNLTEVRAGLPLSLKYFLAKRAAIIGTVEPNAGLSQQDISAGLSLEKLPSQVKLDVDFTVGFAYYFR